VFHTYCNKQKKSPQAKLATVFHSYCKSVSKTHQAMPTLDVYERELGLSGEENAILTVGEVLDKNGEGGDSTLKIKMSEIVHDHDSLIASLEVHCDGFLHICRCTVT
jgi:hypothetical protein